MAALGTALSKVLAQLAQMGPWWTLAVVFGCLAVAYGFAWIVQWRLIRSLRKNPSEPAPLGRIEALFSIFAPLTLLFFLLEGMVRGLYRWLRRPRGNRAEENNKTRSKKETPRPERGDTAGPIRIATLGPSFFLAGILCGLIYWLGWIAKPTLARAFGLSAGHSLWEYLSLGQFAELGWLLPLSQRPRLALLLALLCWLVIWWTLGNLLRGIVWRSTLQRNLAGTTEETLPLWYQGFGVRAHTEPSRSYRTWAAWLVTFGILLLTLAAGALGRPEGAVAPAALAVASVLLLSWVVHLRMRGFSDQPPPIEGVATTAQEVALVGWPTVLQELDQLHGLEKPSPQGRRPLVELAADRSTSDSTLISPLTQELLANLGPEGAPSPRPALTNMQWKVLNTLALHGFVHLDPPQHGGELTLRAEGPEQIENRSGLSERHQIVLAPEGGGKTTLALLAAANHTLIHSRSTLLITQSEAQAEETYERLVAAVESSTVRWNLRRRRVGRDFANDLSRDIIPDVLVCNFHELVTNLLDNSEAFTPFLRNVGLIVVDDVESFTGSEEIHAQLGFRRLHRLFRELADVEQLGEENAPLWLCLGVDTMKETAAWAKSLCGIQAALRTFPWVSPTIVSEDDSTAPRPFRVIGEQSLYSLQDLRTASGRPLTPAEIITACEGHQVPWHYRPCGDGRRAQGYGALLLEKEPEFARSSAANACVVLLEGRWSEVHRELRRLPWAGCQTGRSEIALLVSIDPDEEMACGSMVEGFGFEPDGEPQMLTSLGEELITLPLPIVRPPSGLVVRSHLIADLLQHWIEVKDLLDTFESRVASPLRQLSEQGMLRTEERSDVQSASREYESKVYVRALVGSIAASEEGSGSEGSEEFAPFDKVRRVELISSVAVAVRNRADHTLLRRVEADSVGLIYYPGRVFQSSKGRFVVIGRSGPKHRPGAIEVEPTLYDEISSPRRQCKIVEKGAAERQVERSFTYPLFPPEPLLLGQHSVEIGLMKIEARIQPVATYRLNRSTGEIRSRELHGAAVRRRFATTLSTVALVLRPNPSGSSPEAPELLHAEGRLLAALLRLLMPMLYRDVREHLEVVLHLEPSPGTEVPPSESWRVPLGPQDALYLMDLHREGNGTARALHREGLELPLRFCRHFLREITDIQRLQRLYDHWGNRDEILVDGENRESSAPEDGKKSEGEESVSAHEDVSPGSEYKDSRPGDVEDDPNPSDNAPNGQEEKPSPTTPLPATEQQAPSGKIPWDRVRTGLLAWLDSRLHEEPSRQAAEQAADHDEGEAA